MATLVLVFKKVENECNTKYDTFYSSSKAEIIINGNDIDDVFQSIYTITISKIQKSLAKCSGCIINSVIDHTISISNYNPLAGSNHIKLPKELDHPRKGLIDHQNIDDNEYSKWNILRHLNLTDHHPRIITKADKDFAKKFDFNYIKFPVKTRDIHNTEKKNSISISVFEYENKQKHTIYALEKCCEKNMLICN